MKKQDKLGKTLARLYKAMKRGDKQRQSESKPLIWGEKDWWNMEEDAKIRSKGAQAFRAGKSMRSNPYSTRTNEYARELWFHGWLDEEMSAKYSVRE